MNRVFVTSDTHFGHKKVPTFRPYLTVEEHDRDLIARWNSVVRKKDTVWHLGDVYFGDGWKALEELNGVKKLVMGNHDYHPYSCYFNYFNHVYGAIDYRGCLLTHIPVHESQFDRWRMNIHGHLHHNKLEDTRYRCVSVEHTNYTPILFDHIIPKD
jgi:calcineurin-like phosphoesterase family protein